MADDFFDDEIPGAGTPPNASPPEVAEGAQDIVAPAQAPEEAFDQEGSGAGADSEGAPLEHESGHVFDVTDDDGEVPPAPTGAAFGEATVPEPVGANRRAVYTIAAVVVALFALVTIGVVVAVSSPNSAAVPGAAPQPIVSHVAGSNLGVHHGGSVMSSQALGEMNTSSSSPVPRATNVPCRATPSGMVGPCGEVPPLSAECQREFSPDYVGARSPACIAQANGAQSPVQPRERYQAQPTPQPTEDPAVIAAQQERQEEIAMQRAAAQAPVFVPDGSGAGPAAGPQTPSVAPGGLARSVEQSTARTVPSQASQAAIGMSSGQGALGYQGGSGNAAGSGYRAQGGVPGYVVPEEIQPVNVPANYLAIGAGTWIDVSLYSDVNLALPGGIVAQVERPVCDTKTGAYELIPPGAKFIGAIGPGFQAQGRADGIWSLLRMRDGDEYPLDALHSQDVHGTSGVGAQTDDHRWAIARTGFLSALVATAAGILENRSLPQNSVVLTTPSGGGASSGVPIITSTANRIVKLDASKPTSYRLPHGITFRLYVAKPIYLPPYPGSVGCKPFSQSDSL